MYSCVMRLFKAFTREVAIAWLWPVQASRPHDIGVFPLVCPLPLVAWDSLLTLLESEGLCDGN